MFKFSPHKGNINNESEAEKYYSDLLRDIYSMMCYARESGIAIPISLSKDIAKLLSGDAINNLSKKLNVGSSTIERHEGSSTNEPESSIERNNENEN